MPYRGRWNMSKFSQIFIQYQYKTKWAMIGTQFAPISMQTIWRYVFAYMSSDYNMFNEFLL